MRPLTARALSYWPAWHAAAGHAREALERSWTLTEDEGCALQVFELNVAAAGDRKGWFSWPRGVDSLKIRPSLLDRLFDGLTVPLARSPGYLVRLLAQALQVPEGHMRTCLERAIEKRFHPLWIAAEVAKGEFRGASAPTCPHSQIANRNSQLTQEETTMETTTLSNGKATPQERVAAEIDRIGIDLRQEVPGAVQREIAAALGMYEKSVSPHVSNIRKARGITLDPNARLNRFRKDPTTAGVVTAEKSHPLWIPDPRPPTVAEARPTADETRDGGGDLPANVPEIVPETCGVGQDTPEVADARIRELERDRDHLAAELDDLREQLEHQQALAEQARHCAARVLEARDALAADLLEAREEARAEASSPARDDALCERDLRQALEMALPPDDVSPARWLLILLRAAGAVEAVLR